MIFLSLFILGFTSLVSQIVMTRELIVSFYGNEFFIGWILFGWLFWVGIGSLLIKLLKRPLRGLSLLLKALKHKPLKEIFLKGAYVSSNKRITFFWCGSCIQF